MKKHIPNSLTLLNLFSGCCGIVACMQHQYTLVPIFIGISLLADFLDGRQVTINFPIEQQEVQTKFELLTN